MLRLLSLTLACLCGLVCSNAGRIALSQTFETAEFSPESIEWFEREVRPIFAEHCSSCHIRSVGRLKGEFSLETRESILAGGESGPAIVPGEPDKSLLIEAVRRESFEMPPEKPLNSRELQTLVKWVAMGAPWSEATSHGTTDGETWLQQRFQSHWSWRPMQEPPIPAVREDEWSQRAIDRFILAKLEANEIQPATPCEPHGLLRRLSFDLTGLPPSFALPSQFSEQSYAQQVEQLLGSPQFGVHWGRHWLDLVRYAETLGHEFDYPLRYTWQYRDAVIDAFNADVPYDRLLVEHLAGDQLTPARRHPLTGVDQSLAMTGFWWLGDSVHAPVDLKNDLATRVDNQIDVFSKTFLGLTVACARCHDHKFDAISVKDYYGLAGVIESSRREYAITDPTGSLAEHWWRMGREVAQANQAARSAYSQLTFDESACREWLASYLAKLAALDAKQLDDELPATSPLYALRATLNQRAFSEAFGDIKAQSEQANSDFQKWESDSILFAEFSQGIPASWQLSTTRHSAATTPDLEELWYASEGNNGVSYDWFSEMLPLPNRPGIFSSQKLGRKTSLLLTSPNFALSHNMICLKMRGKSTQSSVIIDNYFMNEFHGLLFSETRKPIDQLADGGWVVHAGDLNKYTGEPTYLSFHDEDRAWFEIEEVRFANRQPPNAPHRVTLDLVRQNFEHADDLLAALGNHLIQAVKRTTVDLKDTKSREARQAEPDPETTLAISVVRAFVQASLRNGLPLPESLQKLSDVTKSLHELDEQTPEPTLLLATSEGSPRNARVDTRGNPHEPGMVVPRGCLASLPSYKPVAETSSGRLELAESLVDARHPLTARVMVNRVWHHLMGRGLVNSPDNFGVLGGRPTHPELLDYLAGEFIRHNWSIKWLVREIVLSQTYRLSSSATEEQRKLDADGSLWSHHPVRRLTAEALRDAMLATADSLNRELAGPSVAVHLNDQMTGRGRPKDSGPLDGENRRSVYVEVRRNFLDPLLLAFDFPMPSTSAGNRNQSNVPAQALGLLNDPLVLELANRWAAGTETIADPHQRVVTMISTAYGRPATSAEIDRCVEFIDHQGTWAELAHVLLNSKEFSYVK